MQIREAENGRIADLRKAIYSLINHVENVDDEYGEDITEERRQALEAERQANENDRQLLLAKLEIRLKQTIDQIAESRRMREELANEREMLRQKAIIQDITQIREERPNYSRLLEEDEEEAEERQEREKIRGMTQIAATRDNISSLRQTRAALASEAGQLSRAMASGNSNYTKASTEGASSQQSGFGGSDFRNRQLGRLNQGISRIDAAVNFAISDMYRESARMQDDQLTVYRQPEEEEDREEQENQENSAGVDVIL
jgi:hypothetical protein